MTGTCIIRRQHKFSVVIYGGIDPETGKPRRKWFGGFNSRREAEAFRVVLAHHPAFSAGAGPYGNTRLRIGDYLDTWLDNHTQTKQLEQKTAERYEQFIRLHIKPTVGGIPLVRLSPQAIQNLYRRSLQAGLSPTTVRHIANLLHEALGSAVRLGLVARNPSDQAEPPARVKTSPATLTPEQVQRYLDDARHTATPPIYSLYLTKIGTGLRMGELLGLRETDLDLERGVLHVTQDLKKPGPAAAFGKPKTDRSRRPVLLPAEVIVALRQLAIWRKEQRLKMGPKFCGYGLVFSSPTGKPLHANNIRYRDHYPRLQRLGLPRIRPHDLRHTHATYLIAAGVDPRTVADRLGHSSPAFTLSVYAHAVPWAQERAAETANRLLTKSGRFGIAQ